MHISLGKHMTCFRSDISMPPKKTSPIACQATSNPTKWIVNSRIFYRCRILQNAIGEEFQQMSNKPTCVFLGSKSWYCHWTPGQSSSSPRLWLGWLTSPFAQSKYPKDHMQNALMIVLNIEIHGRSKSSFDGWFCHWSMMYQVHVSRSFWYPNWVKCPICNLICLFYHAGRCLVYILLLRINSCVCGFWTFRHSRRELHSGVNLQVPTGNLTFALPNPAVPENVSWLQGGTQLLGYGESWFVIANKLHLT